MKDVELIKLILFLKNIPNLGDRGLYKIFHYINNENIFNILSFSKDELYSIGLNNDQIEYIKNSNWEYPNQQLSIAKKNNVNIISIFDKKYPEILKEIYDPPLLLFYKGNIDILRAELFALVGTRKPTIYGRNCAEYFSSELLARGYIITSGFARGIDIAAHMTVVNQQQPTVAVLGTSLDYIYPAMHKKYVEQIIKAGGVIISEAIFTTPPLPSCFPKRNRIISGLSKGVLVVEAARKSGSLITAKCAAEQGREVFAVPGNINNHQALGCLDLIAQGAKLTIDVEDILEELTGVRRTERIEQVLVNPVSLSNGLGSVSTNSLNQFSSSSTISPSFHGITSQSSRESSPSALTVGAPKKHKKNKNHTLSLNFGLSSEQQLLFDAISGGVVELDSLIDSTQLDINNAMAQLLQLEMMGLISQTSGGYTIL